MANNSIVRKIELYILSLWFLFFLIIIVTIDVPVDFSSDSSFIGFSQLIKRNITPLCSLLLLGVGAISYLRFKNTLKGTKSLPVRVLAISDLNYEHLTFLTTYIIPLICFNLSSPRYVVSLAILLVAIGIIYVKTDKFYVNPTLAILGFKLFSVELSGGVGQGKPITVISKDRLSVGDQLRLMYLDEKVCFGRKEK